MNVFIFFRKFSAFLISSLLYHILYRKDNIIKPQNAYVM